ncbi:MAG: tryptophan 7-halogenase [Pelomonas sp.]|nr:tryptophan 7-halogenase [Burkholderiaceae bacterium]MBV8605088.1 tryptophan 7-halogenase [Roseateles sp.]
MSTQNLKTIVIAGGGTAGWMTAAALAKTLGRRYDIRLVESDEIGTIGVGEATIPMIQRFNAVLEIDENEFIRETQGTFKLGIEFVDWGAKGESYMHGFGRIGQDLGLLSFDKYWQKLSRQGRAAPLGAYTMSTSAAYAGRFMRPRPDMPNSPLKDITYAYQFDAGLYARYLRRYAERLGVQRIEGRITDVRLNGESGFVESVRLANEEHVPGDLFIDCSGFRGLLIEQTLEAGFEDWSHWLPCDRAVAVPSANAGAPSPFTRATARSAGWQWRIPLQHRTGNGHVYCSRYMSDDEACAVLLANLEGERLAEPRMLRFQAGVRRESWRRNVVAIGLSSGFMEPLESTSIHLIQTAIARLVEFLPDAGFDARDIAAYNRLARQEYEWIRDFLILHYKQNRRDDSPFWRDCAAMEIPASLRQRMDLYQAHGRILREGTELFTEVSWLQVMNGQGLVPQGHHPLVDQLSDAALFDYLEDVRKVIAQCVNVMPTQADYIARHCRAPAP